MSGNATGIEISYLLNKQESLDPLEAPLDDKDCSKQEMSNRLMQLSGLTDGRIQL